MKRSMMKMMRTIFLILMMAVMIPAAASAALQGGGSGTKEDPHVISVGVCTKETFVYTTANYEDYAWWSYLDVKFTVMGEVSFRNQGDKIMTFKRDGMSTYKSLSYSDSLIVKKGETIHLCIKGVSQSTNKLTINCKKASTSEYCPDNVYGTHTFVKDHDSKCQNCGYKCKHPKASREYYNEYSAYNGKHMQRFSCSVCQEVSLTDKADQKNCTFKKWTHETNFDRHYADCTVCGNTYTEDCALKTSYKKDAWDTHVVTKTCTKCKEDSILSSKKGANHTFKNNVCTKCKFKRIVPGTLKVTSAKQSGKMKSKKTYYPAKWVYEVSSGWVHKKAHTVTEYKYPISMKVNKTKNVTKYVVSYTKYYHEDNVIASSTKTSFKCTYSANKKVSKATMYIIPLSKTGTPGKAIKKVIKLSNK